MSQTAKQLLDKIHHGDPYAEFDHHRHPFDVKGGDPHPIFKLIIEGMRPRLIIEVGTWKGASALHMAEHLKRLDLDAAVLCVDTWLGGLEHWEYRDNEKWGIGQYCDHGYPKLYYQFLANVLHAQLQDYIVPLPTASSVAARYLKRAGVVADVIYIDASHEEDDVYQDLVQYWDLLSSQGILFGDDWHSTWFGVICAVNRFAREHRLQLRVDGTKWAIRKP